MESEGIRRNPTLICTPLMAESVEKMMILMNKAKLSGADLVEVRLDSLDGFSPREDIEKLIKHCPLPTLFTHRSVNLGKKLILKCKMILLMCGKWNFFKTWLVVPF